MCFLGQVALEAELRDSRAAAWADAELNFSAERATAEVGGSAYLVLSIATHTYTYNHPMLL